MNASLQVQRLAASMALCCVFSGGADAQQAAQSGEPATPSLARLTEALSESGGYFDTDNLVSNERSYVQVIDRLEPRGGAYIGVGPEQNYNYIGRLRPEWAFVVDLRPDNRLHHLLLIALLAEAESPYEYLCWLFSRTPDNEPSGGSTSLAALIERFEKSPHSDLVFERNLKAIEGYVDRLGIELSDVDRARLRSIYGAFDRDQLEIRFRSHGRPPGSRHPSYRTLLEARTPGGRPAHFLAHPEDYHHLRDLARRGRLVPVVGDFGGEQALAAVGAFLSERGETVTAFYTSNVEYYLFGSARYSKFVENVRRLPVDQRSVFIRACFDYGYSHPERLPGHRSTMLLQRIESFLELWDAGRYRSYWEVCTRDYLGATSEESR